MHKYILYYDGGFLEDSSETNDGYLYDTPEDATEEAKAEIEGRIDCWEIDGVEFDRELFEFIIEEV